MSSSGTGATTCTITGLTDGTSYSITVLAHTTAGDSGASEPASVTPEPPGLITGPIVSGYWKNKCVDASAGTARNGTPVVIWDCNRSTGQNWVIEADGTIRISGKCLDIYRERQTNGAPVDLWTCTGRGNQQWRPLSGTLVNPVSGRCLDDPTYNTTDHTQLQIYTCNRGRNQQWELP